MSDTKPSSIQTHHWTSKTVTTLSPDYHKVRTFFKETFWYDVYPYSLSLWPGTFHEAVFNGWWWNRRIKDICVTVETVVSGEVVYECKDRVMTLTPGNVYIQIPDHDVLCRNGVHRNTRHFQLTLFGGFTSFFSVWFGIREPAVISFSTPSETETVLRNMKRIGALLEKKDMSTAVDIYTLCHRLLADLARAYHASSSTRFYPEIVSNAIFRIESNLENGVTISEIAMDLGVSEMTLLRSFRKYLYMSPSEYILKIRMEKAVGMLTDPVLPIKEVAARLGYKNQLYFSAAFRKYYGISPGNWRKQFSS